MKLKLHWQVLIAMVLGGIFAAVFGEVGWVARVADLFMRLLRMIIVPLIMAAPCSVKRSTLRLSLEVIITDSTTAITTIIAKLTSEN